MTTTAAPLYTVWNHVRYTDDHTEVFSGEDFAEALAVAVTATGGTAVRPLDPTNTPALHKVGGMPIQAWLTLDADGTERTVFITR